MNGSRPSLVRRVFGMVCTWLVLGAAIAVIDGLESGASIRFATVMNSGMVALPIAGAVLGLVGGDVTCSAAGAAAALLGCWAAQHFGRVPVEPDIRHEVVIVGAFFGAIGGPFFRPIFGDVCILFRRICRAADRKPASAESSAPPPNALVQRR